MSNSTLKLTFWSLPKPKTLWLLLSLDSLMRLHSLFSVLHQWECHFASRFANFERRICQELYRFLLLLLAQRILHFSLWETFLLFYSLLHTVMFHFLQCALYIRIARSLASAIKNILTGTPQRTSRFNFLKWLGSLSPSISLSGSFLLCKVVWRFEGRERERKMHTQKV